MDYNSRCYTSESISVSKYLKMLFSAYSLLEIVYFDHQ